MTNSVWPTGVELSYGGGRRTSRRPRARWTEASTCTSRASDRVTRSNSWPPTDPRQRVKETVMSETVEVAKRRHGLSELATKKVFRRLVPFLLLMYVIAFLDRSNVSFAQQEFEADFGISTASYAFGAGLFFVGYAIFEIPSNLLLHRVGAR